MIKAAIQSVLNTLGYRLTRLTNAPAPCWGLENFFPLLMGFGFNPKHIVDIGANTGGWTRTAIKYFPHAHYTLVEPQDELKNHIQDLVDAGRQIHWINAGASDQPGEMSLQVQHRKDASTFCHTPNSVGQIRVQMRTVNEIVASSGLPIPEMVKIDAEGFDLKVLAGASNLFGKTEVFLAEAGIVPTGMDNTASALIQTMSDAGYRLIDITDINRSPQSGLLWLCEFAFLLRTSHLLDNATAYENPLLAPKS
jgi:FkbM family methyltransferase